MKIIALEEAFAIRELQLGDRAYVVPDVYVSDEFKHWCGPRLFDFSQWRLPEMDRNGVEVQVLSLTAPGIQAATSAEMAVSDARIANNYLADVVPEYPGRFKGFAALPLQDPEAAVLELRRCVSELGFCGALVNE
ncbi:amidohydrolase family protein [Serratia marcescens]|uniref:amidohydrolase family protein n=1 Tax=Serratia marcescens TaxID=615 RepID=UPI003A8A1659